MGAWAVVVCWGLLLTTLVLVYREPEGRRAARTPTPIPLGLGRALVVTAPHADRGAPGAPGGQLAALLRLRPDLTYPLPRDLTELASRATTATSVARALDALDAWCRLVAEALAACPTPPRSTTCRPCWASRATSGRGVAELRRRALLWGADDQLHLVRPVREAFEPYPGGLAPPSPRPSPPRRSTRRSAGCEPAVRPVLDRLLWSPTGAVRNAGRAVAPEAARSPVEQLLARGLLRPLDAETVVLPREVAWRLRGGRFAPQPVPPPPGGDRAGALAAAGRPGRGRGGVRAAARRRAGRARRGDGAAPAAADRRRRRPRRHGPGPAAGHRRARTPPSSWSAPPPRGWWRPAGTSACCPPPSSTAGPARTAPEPLAAAGAQLAGRRPLVLPPPRSRARTRSAPTPRPASAPAVRSLLLELAAGPGARHRPRPRSS